MTTMTRSMTRRGWQWAYRKIRGWGCSPLSAAYRAARYSLFGTTGSFWGPRRLQRYRISA